MPGTGPGASRHWFSPLRGLRGRRWPSPVSGQDTHRGPERLDPLLKCQGCRSAIPAPRTPKPPLPAAGPALAGSRLGHPRQALSLLHLNRWQRHPAGSWGGGPRAGKRTDGHGAASSALARLLPEPSERAGARHRQRSWGEGGGPPGKKETKVSVGSSGSRPRPLAWLHRGLGGTSTPSPRLCWLSGGGRPAVTNPRGPLKMSRSRLGKGVMFLQAAAHSAPTRLS